MLVVLHDLNLAARYWHRSWALLAGGRVVADGEPARVLTRHTWPDAYGRARGGTPRRLTDPSP
ncbi:hypothetical protein GCM10020220_013450 [Nonomuraea rubra]